MSYPIPKDALDGRLAFVGTAGSGKTYNAGTGVEMLLLRDARVVIADPLGVWWPTAARRWQDALLVRRRHLRRPSSIPGNRSPPGLNALPPQARSWIDT